MADQKQEKSDYQFDFSKSNIYDWDLIVRSQKKLNYDDIPLWNEFLERVMIGGKDTLKSIPMTALREIVETVYDKVAELSNPKAPAA